MKKIFILLFSTIWFSSCDGFLDTKPSDQIVDEDAFANIDAAQTVLTGAYDFLSLSRTDQRLIQNILFGPDLMGEDCMVASVGNYNRFLGFYQYNMIKTGTTSKESWLDAYTIIDNLNALLSKIESLPQNEARDRVQGEALTLRAYCYHFLVRLYAKPYKVNPESKGLVLREVSSLDPTPRSTVKDVYTLLERDLLKAVGLLKNSSKKSYFDKRAAQAILARVYLDMAKNDKAMEYAGYAADGVTLMSKDDYPTAKFSDYNSETIFAYEVSSDDNPYYMTVPSFWYFANGGAYDADGELDYRGVISGYSSLRIPEGFVSLFDDKDVRKKFFPKIDGTDEYLYVVEGELLTTKFQHRGGGFGQGAVNYIRASEMYLIIAEAAADQSLWAQAKTALNKIKTTRGLDEYSGADGQALIDEIQLERRRELFAEGHRLFDIKRRGLPMSRKGISGHWDIREWPANSDRFELPIPQKEIDANKALTDADQNPAYK